MIACRPSRLLCSLAAFLAPLAATASPIITLSESSVALEGLTPEGRAVLFSIGQPPGHLMRVTARHEEVVAPDAAGAVTVELSSPVAERSVWAVVDVESGEWALAAPEGFELRQIDFPGRGIGAAHRTLRNESRFLEVLVVRPASALPEAADRAAESGVWGRTFGDGGEDDADGATDGAVEAPIERLRPVGDSPALPPGELRPGDVVVAVDPMTLEIYAATLAF